jgi:hypothetical protein
METQLAKIRCMACNTMLTAEKTLRGSSCGCDNQTYVTFDRHGQLCITGKDLSMVELIHGCPKPKKNPRYYDNNIPQEPKRKPTSDLSKIQIL